MTLRARLARALSVRTGPSGQVRKTSPKPGPDTEPTAGSSPRDADLSSRTGPAHQVRKTSLRARLAAGLALVVALGTATPAAAWDARATHLGMVDRAILESAVHLRWMASSELQRGLFTPLRVDPRRLTPSERRMLSAALQHGGLEALGGPGACPGLGSPLETQRYCVDGDLWELPALQWLQLGVLAELVPSARAVHHFVDRDDPLRADFRDPQQNPALLRLRQVRHNGAVTATLANQTAFSGQGPSVISWLRDEADPLAPTRMWQHLELASTLPEPLARDHHMALALVGLGALLHVVQDLAVPAHARGDVSGFFSPLSQLPGDRGLPFSELARLGFGRNGLPGRRTDAQIAEVRGTPIAASIAEHLFGGAAPSKEPGALVLTEGTGYEGLAVFTARRFLSEASVPAPRHLDDTLSPEDAAAELLRDAKLDPGEIQGARLHPWPAERGYIHSGTGRPLAAFDTDDDGRVRPYVDEAVYREQFVHLAPRAVEVTRSLLDWVWPAWPELLYDAAAGNLDFVVPAGLREPVALVLRQNGNGARTIVRKLTLRPGERNRVNGIPTNLGEGERAVVVLRARRPGGEPLLLEHILGSDSKVFPVVPAPYVAPPAAEEPVPEASPEPTEAPEESAEPVEAPPAELEPPAAPAAGGKSGKPGKTATGPKGQPTTTTSPKGQPPAGKAAATPPSEPGTSPKGQPPAGKAAATSPAEPGTSPKGQAPAGKTATPAPAEPGTSPKGQPPASTSPKSQPPPDAGANGQPPASPKGPPPASTSPKSQPPPSGAPAETPPASPGAGAKKKP